MPELASKRQMQPVLTVVVSPSKDVARQYPELTELRGLTDEDG